LPENGDIDEVANRANELLGDFLDTLRKRLDRERTLNDKVKVLQDAYGPDIDALKRREDDLFKQLVGLVTPRFSELVRKNTKTIYLRNGEIQRRTASKDKLDYADGYTEQNILKQIKRLGGLRRFTVLKRTVTKDALKKDPKFLAKLKGLVITRKVSMIIRPSNVQGEEIVRETNPLIVPFPEQD
jgi:phage host-nuclease inhibitor protein Gam